MPTEPTTPPIEEEFDFNEALNILKDDTRGGITGYQQYIQKFGFVPVERPLHQIRQGIFQGGTGIYGDMGKAGERESRSFEQRSRLPITGEAKQAYEYWDESEGVTVSAPLGSHFELYAGGGVKTVSGLIKSGTTLGSSSSLFAQPTQGKVGGAEGEMEATPGFFEEKLGYQPIEGKEIAETGQTVFNPATGVDEHAGEGEVLIRYTDNTVERRKFGATPGTSVAETQFGRTAEELGITDDTEIKGPGGEIARAPIRGEQAPADNSGLEYIGREYAGANGQKRVAPEGQAYYQDPSTRTILLRPDTGAENALPSTSPSILAARNDIGGMFEAVYGRKPNAAELKYWQGRTDKTGAALLGAMQFAKAENKTIGGIPTGQAGGDPIAAIDNAIAASGDADFSKLTAAAGGTIDLSKSAQLVDKLTQMLTAKPDVPSLRDEYEKELLRSGFNEDSAALGEAERAIKQLDADFMSTLEGEEARRVSIGQIRRRQGAQEIAYNRIRRDMIVERDYLANKVAGKQAIVNTMVQLTGQDIANAQADYQNKFQNALAITNLVRGIEQDQLTAIQRQQDNARANVQIMSGLLASGNVKYAQLDAATKSQLKSMELQAGLPIGFTQFVAETVKSPEVQFLPAYTDINGVRIQPIATINPQTGAYTIKNVNQGKVDLPVTAKGSGTAKLSEAQKEGNKFLSDAQGLQEKMIAGDYNWQQSWDTLHVRYPTASIETIDNALGTSFRNKYNK